ncbi:hypothetical protein MUK42_30800 [Musa troglodytarum]|uniref:Uncharacterized protein n=1 Tax=Musa troglodytarum TaxID=320322 RepID=A0A9E7EXH0_9LILI|nr:hypothetical protein MUK42_30800 [Musa troglodytarum]
MQRSSERGTATGATTSSVDRLESLEQIEEEDKYRLLGKQLAIDASFEPKPQALQLNLFCKRVTTVMPAEQHSASL